MGYTGMIEYDLINFGRGPWPSGYYPFTARTPEK
jgi:hypothetical protein